MRNPLLLFGFTLLLMPHLSHAGEGVASTGVTGGLVIPNANVLAVGEVAASFNNFQEPALGLNTRRRNFALGFGLVKGLEFSGRFAEYVEPLPGTTIAAGGIRDISANFKLRLPRMSEAMPNFAVGVNDLNGGANRYKSIYGVASDDLGPFSWTLGLAKGSPSNSSPLDGLFGGVQYHLGGTGVSVLGEYDGQHRHVGVRYQSPRINALGGSQIVATVQRALPARSATGLEVQSTSAGVSVIVPLGLADEKRSTFQPEMALPPLSVKDSGGMQRTALDRQDALVAALTGAGLERVRVGLQGKQLMLVEYENYRYGQSEADALGIVLGLAVEFAPAEVKRVAAVTLKAGLRVYETAVDVAVFRNYLRDGDMGLARTSLTVDRAPSYNASDVQWVDAQPSKHALLRVEVAPDFVYHLGTELAAFDYSLALAFKFSAPLWRGGELQATYVKHITNTPFFEDGFAWGEERQRTGIKSFGLQQSLWLSPYVHASVGVGKYNYDNTGAQVQSSIFVPGTDDSIRLRGAFYQKPPSVTNPQRAQMAASYRWVPTTTTWVEAGVQQFGDGGRGPSLVLTRWFGDVGVHMHYHRSGQRQVAGLDVSLPLTPRQGMAPGVLQFTGTSYFRKGIRTRILNPINDVSFDGARDLALEYNAEVQTLNGGRFSQRYFVGQLPRMRESFFLYARHLLNP